ncbi:MAG TPA: putative Ig domain-containing protein [Thermoanaerobaculia bacterium]
MRLRHGARRPASFALGTVLFPAAVALATTAVPQWQQLFHPPSDGTTSAAPIAARELADGTILVVTDALNAVHYDADGNVLSAQALRIPRATTRRHSSKDVPDSPGFGDSHAAIDAFGKVVVAVVDDRDYVLEGAGDVETARFDGLTGQALWRAPVLYHSGFAMIPTDVFLDAAGDVVVTAVSGISFVATLKYDGRTGALLWGPNLIQNLSTWSGTRPSRTALDPEGNVFVTYANGADQISTLKYSAANGSILWGPVIFHDANQRPNLPRSILVRADGTVIVAGLSGPDFLTLAYNGMSGGPIWGPSVYTPPDAFPNSLDDTNPSVLTCDAAGSVFVSGTYRNQAFQTTDVTFKLAGGGGALLWTANSNATSDVREALLFGNGDLGVLGGTGTGSDFALSFWRYRGVDGRLLLPPTAIASPPNYGPAAFVSSAGRLFVAEYTDVLSSGEWDGMTGAPIWGPAPFEYPFVGIGYFEDLAAGPDGNPVSAGETLPNYTIDLVKYARTTGAVLWGPVTYSASEWQRAWQVQVDANNDVILVGYYQDGPDVGGMLLKFSGASGALIWGPVKFSGFSPWRIALDPAGNVLMMSYDPAPVSGIETVLHKVSGANGSVLWGPVVYHADNYGYPRALAIDPAGDVYITGMGDVGLDNRWFVLKYSGASGSVLWGPKSDVIGEPHGIAADASGAAVTGGGDTGMTTAKYASASGSLLWGPVDAPGGDGDTVAIAGNGDVVVAGTIFNGVSSDWGTIRYDGGDGTVIWGPMLVDGDGHGTDFPYTLGVSFDASGNVVVGGSIRTATRNWDLGVIKYAAADGATLWGPVLAGGVENEYMSGFDVRGNSIAVGATSDAAMLTMVFDESLGIATPGPLLSPGFCGHDYATPIVVQNGTMPYTLSIVSGSLPPGLGFAGTLLTGTPTEEGTFTFTVRATDSAAAHADRAFTIVVTDDPMGSAILAQPAPACHTTLSVPGVWTSYLWLPNGETTPTIDVAPLQTTTYGVTVTDASGCALLLEAIVPGTALQDPSCLAPAVKAIAPASGPASGASVTIAGGNFQPGAQLEIGGQLASSAFENPAQLSATTPVLPAGTLNTVVVTNPDSGNAALVNGFFADFLDVPQDDIFHDSIEKLFRRGVTAGCNPGLFCPGDDTTRAQMAVFLLKSLLGAGYVPPQQTGGIFADVPFEAFAAAWIEDLYNRGVTGGCLLDPLRYCPDANVTRAEMAVFLLKTLLGKDYVPPAATGTVFADVAAGDFAAAWIEDLYHRGITAGCLTDPLRYCPDASVTREEMAAFLVRTFGL